MVRETSQTCVLAIGFILSLFIFTASFVHSSEDLVNPTINSLHSSAKDKILEEVRLILSSGQIDSEQIKRIKILFKKSNFPSMAYGCGMVIYSPSQKRILIVKSGKVGVDNLISVLKASVSNSRIKNLSWKNDDTRIQIDFILDQPKLVDFLALSADRGVNHFELGVDGLLMQAGEKNIYFLPGDAFVKSYFNIDEVRSFLKRSMGQQDLTKASVYQFRTQSYISYGQEWISLFRGYPVVTDVTPEDLMKAVDLAVTHVKSYQQGNGQFLYFYEAAKDSLVDLEHPKRDPKVNPYYNELRHVGGVLFLMEHYRQYRDKTSLAHAKKAIDFMIKELLQIYDFPNGTQGEYMYFNQKGKLGGSGLALYALSYYQHLTGDTFYVKHAERLARHLLSQVTDTGEFIYYYRYKEQYVSKEENTAHFNFYYPGEALIGLVGYYKYIAEQNHNPLLQTELKDKIAKSLDFLIHQRPLIYASSFQSLPSDSWLMMAINELWDIPELRKDFYKDFVYQDAQQMISLMYTKENAYFSDYVGSFYYAYGDFPYADGARCEGLLAAYELAVKAKDENKINQFFPALKMSAWATLHLVNTPESVYSVPNPAKAVGGIRFKHTRQWFRIDTIAHVASFYLKFLPYFNKTKN